MCIAAATIVVVVALPLWFYSLMGFWVFYKGKDMRDLFLAVGVFLPPTIATAITILIASDKLSSWLLLVSVALLLGDYLLIYRDHLGDLFRG